MISTVAFKDLFGLVAPAAAALAVAAGGAVLARRRPGLMPIVAPLAALTGWALVFYGALPGPWRASLWPGVAGESVLWPTLVLAVAGALSGRLRSRWLGVGAVAFAGWWLAASGAGRPEFWRVWFASALIAWLLARSGAAQPRRALAVCLTLLGGLLAGSAPSGWTAVAAVVTAAALGMFAGGRPAVIAPGLLMLGLVAADLGSGRLVRGRLGLVDLMCLAAVGASGMMGPTERILRRRRKGLEVIAAPVAAAFMIAAGWVLWRVLRSY